MGKAEDNKKPSHTKKTVLYRMIYEDIKEKILSQTYQDNERLPFERELCEAYNVDRVTVRKSLDLLVADGLIEKRPGLGSFVKSPVTGGSTSKTESRNILFVMSDNTNDVKSNPSAFNSKLFHAIEQECRHNGYSLFYAVVDEQTSLASLINGNEFAGILFVSYIPPHILEQCVQMQLPIICLNNRFPNVISIVPEDERGAYDAVKYLNSQGHQRIGIILGKSEYYSATERFRGYSIAMFEAGVQMDPRFVLQGDWTFDGAREAVFRLLDTVPAEELPTALFCCSDVTAIGAIDALKERDVSVPKEMSVVGFDNISQSVHIYPRLTTIAVNTKLMAELAIEKVTAYSSETEGRGYLIQVPTSLEIRQSVHKI